MKKAFYFVNGISIFRIVAAPVLVLLLVFHYYMVFRWLLIFCFITDALDGYLSRLFNVTSKIGAKLDSIGDDLTVGASIIGLIVLYPQFLLNNLLYIIPLFVIYLIHLVMALLKFRKMTGFHTYSAKVAAIFQAIFLLHAFFYQPHQILFYLTIFLTLINLVEEIMMIYQSKEWKADVKGYRTMRKEKTQRKSFEKS